MKRLIKKSEELQEQNEHQKEDPYLGKYFEIVNPRSKYFGFNGWVDKNYASDDRYKLYIVPKEYEEFKDEYHINFIKTWDATKWLSIVEYGDVKEYEE